jgi:alcohol dehydrogenase
MSTIRAAQVTAAGADFEIVEQPVPEPGQGQVRVAVEACGICHSDAAFQSGVLPGLTFPLVTGHEIAGTVDEVGPGVTSWQVGDRVAVGWFGGNCGECRSCRAGDFITCDRLQVPGWAYPGGFAEAVVVPANALARIPDGITAAEAAPMACAGVTTFNGLRRSIALPGDVVAVLGVGGLGHLGVQFAAKLGFTTVAIARGRDKEPLARQLGAHHYIDSTEQDVAAALRDLGGAKVVLATAANADAMSATIDGLAPRGQLIALGASMDALRVTPTQLLMRALSVVGHPSGTSLDTEDTLRFAATTGVRAMIEEQPLAEVNSAFARMTSGAARFRVVLTMAS